MVASQGQKTAFSASSVQRPRALNGSKSAVLLCMVGCHAQCELGGNSYAEGYMYLNVSIILLSTYSTYRPDFYPILQHYKR